MEKMLIEWDRKFVKKMQFQQNEFIIIVFVQMIVCRIIEYYL